MADQGLRTRVERLLNSDVRSDDLTRLFLFARDRCDGRESVQEIGDFVAHHDVRTKGAVTKATRDWAAIVEVSWKNLNHQMTAQRLPSCFREYLSATLERIGHKLVAQKTGLSLAQAHRMLPKINAKFLTNADGTLFFSPSTYTPKEAELVVCLSNVITVRGAFDDHRLFDDFRATLKSHGLLKKEEMRPFEALKPVITLFAVTEMHNCVVQFPDGKAVTLKITAPFGGKIGVSASVPVETTSGKLAALSAEMFSTGLVTETFCEPVLLVTPQPWDCALEIGPGQKLSPLA